MTTPDASLHRLPRLGLPIDVDPDEVRAGIDRTSLADALRVIMRIAAEGVVSIRGKGLSYVVPPRWTEGADPHAPADPATARLTATLTPVDAVNVALVVRMDRAVLGQVTLQFAHRIVADLVADRRQRILRTRISDLILRETLAMLAAAHRDDLCPPQDLARYARHQSAILLSAMGPAPSEADDAPDPTSGRTSAPLPLAGNRVDPDRPFGGAYAPFCATPGRAHHVDDDKWIPTGMDAAHQSLSDVADRILGKVFVLMRGCRFDKPGLFDVLLVRHHVDLPRLGPQNAMRTLGELATERSLPPSFG
jgi:hypothetical protein